MTNPLIVPGKPRALCTPLCSARKQGRRQADVCLARSPRCCCHLPSSPALSSPLPWPGPPQSRSCVGTRWWTSGACWTWPSTPRSPGPSPPALTPPSACLSILERRRQPRAADRLHATHVSRIAPTIPRPVLATGHEKMWFAAFSEGHGRRRKGALLRFGGGRVLKGKGGMHVAHVAWQRLVQCATTALLAASADGSDGVVQRGCLPDTCCRCMQAAPVCAGMRRQLRWSRQQRLGTLWFVAGATECLPPTGCTCRAAACTGSHHDEGRGYRGAQQEALVGG